MDYQERQQFHALKATANTLIGFGGLIILVCIFVIIGGISQSSSAYGVSAFMPLIYFFAGGVGILSGTVIVGIGQLLKCFMGVYDNTWKANTILKKQNEHLVKNFEQLKTIRQYQKMSSPEQ